jgi:hypothetical protein
MKPLLHNHSIIPVMSEDRFHKIPNRDPVSGGPLYISELTAMDSGIQIRGKFEIPVYARLEKEQSEFLEAFLRCRFGACA